MLLIKNNYKFLFGTIKKLEFFIVIYNYVLWLLESELEIKKGNYQDNNKIVLFMKKKKIDYELGRKINESFAVKKLFWKKVCKYRYYNG